MADLFETTVVDPSIPPGDILTIELMLLAEIFTLDGDDDRIYLHTENNTAQILHLTASELSAACLETVGECIAKTIANVALLKATASDDKVAVDLSDDGWTDILADIVKRSTTLDFITVETGYSCSKPRKDGFGGRAIYIDGETIAHMSTHDWLQRMIAEAEANRLAISDERTST